MPLEVRDLHRQIFALLAARNYPEAESLLAVPSGEWSANERGQWHYLRALTMRRSRPADRAAFQAECAAATPMLWRSHEALCALYLLQSGAALSWGDDDEALTYLRRLRGLFRRHPQLAAVRQFEGQVLFNEGFIARRRALWEHALRLYAGGIEHCERYGYPQDLRTRRGMIAMAHLESAVICCRLGDSDRALVHLLAVSPADVPNSEAGRYAYTESFYRLCTGATEQARSLFMGLRRDGSLDPEWPCMRCELGSRLYALSGDNAVAQEQLLAAILTARTQRRPTPCPLPSSGTY